MRGRLTRLREAHSRIVADGSAGRVAVGAVIARHQNERPGSTIGNPHAEAVPLPFVVMFAGRRFLERIDLAIGQFSVLAHSNPLWQLAGNKMRVLECCAMFSDVSRER